jgi:small subunit ribosomal protein S6
LNSRASRASLSAPVRANGVSTWSYPEERRFFPMRNYELVCIAHPDLDENAFKAVVEKVSGWVTESGGTVDKVDVWGRRRMAYHINKQREGQYVLLHLNMAPTATADLERNIRFQETIMRSMLTVVE